MNYAFKPQFPMEELSRMQRGWTPEQVRRLIKDYQEVVLHAHALESSRCQHCVTFSAAMMLATAWQQDKDAPTQARGKELEERLRDAQTQVLVWNEAHPGE
jgi:hypothetical protein